MTALVKIAAVVGVYYLIRAVLYLFAERHLTGEAIRKFVEEAIHHD